LSLTANRLSGVGGGREKGNQDLSYGGWALREGGGGGVRGKTWNQPLRWKEGGATLIIILGSSAHSDKKKGGGVGSLRFRERKLQ